MKILYIAEVVGKAGIFALKKALPELKKNEHIDFTIVCGDGATGGNGMGRNHAGYIRKLGADAITTGDYCFYKKDLVENWVHYVLRPANLADFRGENKKDKSQDPNAQPPGNQFLINLPQSTRLWKAGECPPINNYFAIRRALARPYTEKNEEFLSPFGCLCKEFDSGYLRTLRIQSKTPRSSKLSEGQRSSAVKNQKLNSLAQPPGLGWRIFKLDNTDNTDAPKIAVAVLLGGNFSRLRADNPFNAFKPLLEKLKEQTPFIVLDFHAWASGEKRILFAAAAGHCTAVIGSHTRVQSADEAIMDGTAVICDAGRTGSIESVGGNDTATRIQEYLSGIPDWTKEAWDTCELQGVIIDADDSGRATGIKRIRLPVQG